MTALHSSNLPAREQKRTGDLEKDMSKTNREKQRRNRANKEARAEWAKGLRKAFPAETCNGKRNRRIK